MLFPGEKQMGAETSVWIEENLIYIGTSCTTCTGYITSFFLSIPHLLCPFTMFPFFFLRLWHWRNFMLILKVTHKRSEFTRYWWHLLWQHWPDLRVGSFSQSLNAAKIWSKHLVFKHMFWFVLIKVNSIFRIRR